MKRWLALSLTFTISFLLLAPSVQAGEIVKIDYLGFGWENGGIPPSNAGDVFKITAIADFIDPIFGVDLATEEVTLYLYDLVSTGEVDIGGGARVIAYTGGNIDVFADPLMNHVWGINPPNPEQATFTNGTLLFRGAFTSFTLTLNTSGAGVYEGTLDGVGGAALATLCTNCAYSFAGSFTRATGAQIPEGYDLQVDGLLDVDSAVTAETTGWGALKALYGR